MNLDNIGVTLRPRDGWQAVDLGFQMARRWLLPLAALWLCLALPFYLLLKALPLPGFFTLLIWWWFKPLYEAPLSFWCSRAMFSETVSHRQALIATLRRSGDLLKSYLSIRRLSTSRSQNMNVIMLENLQGKAAKERIEVLDRMATRTLALIYTCFHFEAILFYGLLLLGLFITPWGSDFEQTLKFLSGDSDSIVGTTIIEITTIIAGSLIAPFYVCAGFSLYINRRTQLEAWDIELDFRRMANRNRPARPGNTLPAILIATIVTLSMLPIQPVLATATPEQASTTIEQILQGRDFGYTSTEKKLRLKDLTKDDEADEEDTPSPDTSAWFRNTARFLEAVLWILFLAAVAALGVAVYKQAAVQEFAARLGWRRQPQTDSTVFDLDIRPHTLPEDIPAVAKGLIAQDRKREAMSLLYRGALSRLVHHHGMTIEPGETENQCVNRVVSKQNQYTCETFTQLTSLWQQTAYAKTAPDQSALINICEHWQPAFDIQSDNADA